MVGSLDFDTFDIDWVLRCRCLVGWWVLDLEPVVVVDFPNIELSSSY